MQVKKLINLLKKYNDNDSVTVYIKAKDKKNPRYIGQVSDIDSVFENGGAQINVSYDEVR